MWAFWSYEWSPESTGSHELVVRATDDDGDPQIGRKINGIFDGATGYDTLMARVQG